MNHIVMIGFMGSGKTRVGKRLAQDLGLPFVDVDKVIVKNMKMSVKEIYDRFGEPFSELWKQEPLKSLLKCRREPSFQWVQDFRPRNRTRNT